MVRALPPHIRFGETMQFCINQRQQTLRGLCVSRMHRLQKLCHLTAVAIHACLPQTLWYILAIARGLVGHLAA